MTPLLTPDRNTLEIEVRYGWVNRLMGGDKFPQDVEHERKLKTGRT